MYKLSSLSRPEVSQLVRKQKELLLGHDNFRRFGCRLPLDVKFFHNYNPQHLTPGNGSLCYIQRPVLGSGCFVAEIRHTGGAADITPYVSTAVYDLNDPMTIDYSDLDSFVIFIGLQGSCELTDDKGAVMAMREGETILIPATAKTIKVEGTIKFLETYV
jgi:hypothetical protein